MVHYGCIRLIRLLRSIPQLRTSISSPEQLLKNFTYIQAQLFGAPASSSTTNTIAFGAPSSIPPHPSIFRFFDSINLRSAKEKLVTFALVTALTIKKTFFLSQKHFYTKTKLYVAKTITKIGAVRD